MKLLQKARHLQNKAKAQRGKQGGRAKRKALMDEALILTTQALKQFKRGGK